jgi:hypothetical protein
MRLITPVTMVRRVFVGNAQKSVGNVFFPFSFPSLHLEKCVGHCKKTKKFNYLFVKLN